LPIPAGLAAFVRQPAAGRRISARQQRGHGGPDVRLLSAARVIWQDAAARGERLSQRALARQLREHGHRFPNDQLCQIAQSVGLVASRAA
jgi:hypothetical protein